MDAEVEEETASPSPPDGSSGGGGGQAPAQAGSKDSKNGGGSSQSSPKRNAVDPTLAHLKPGQSINCKVAYGRKDNIMTEVHVCVYVCSRG